MTSTDEQQQALIAQQPGFPFRQFLALCIPVAVVIAAVAFAFVELRASAEIKQIVAAERTNLHQLGGYMAAEISTSINQLRALTEEDAVKSAIESPGHGVPSTLQSLFMAMAIRNPTYQQIRWINEEGNERVRIVRKGNRLAAVDDRQLEDMSEQYYFNAARSLLAGEIYISHLDLSMADDHSDTPITPTLRVATPVYDSDVRFRGIIIINIAMQYMLDALRIAREAGTDTGYALINRNGYWLNVNGQQNQDGIRPDKPGNDFSSLHPAAWERISNSRSGAVELDDGFWIWERLSTDDIIRRVAFAGSSNHLEVPSIHMGELSLKLAVYKPLQSLDELRWNIRMTTLLGALLLLVAFCWGLLYFLRGQLMEKRAEIEVARASARAEHIARLKELEERFHLLVEASSVGMVVVDAEGFILMSNTAAESMLGFDKGGLEGMHVDQLLPASQRSQHARMRTEFLKNPVARKMGQGRKLEALTADGRRIPVEVGLNPFLDHGKQVVLASIIDLS